MAEDWVVVGKLLGPYGIRGWLKLYSHTQPTENIGSYNPLWFQKEGRWQPINVERVQRHGKGLVIKINGCENRDHVAAYTGCEVAIKREQLPALQSDDFYWSDLEGLNVITVQGDNLGKIDHLLETGANDVVSVIPTTDSIDDVERLIPYLWGDVVHSVSLADNAMTVDWDKNF